MSQYQRVFRILGPFIGFALLYFVITNGMSFLQRGQLEAVAEQAAAGTMTGTEGITTTEVAVVTATAGTTTTGAAPVAAAAAATETAAATGTAAVTATAPAVTEAVTETAAAATQAVTETAAAATEAVTETAAAATQAVTETAAAATEAVTATQAATVTAPAPDATTPVTATSAPTTGAAAPAATEAAAAAPAADTSAFLKPDGTASDAVVAAINKGGCIACHTIAGVPNAMGQVGPNLSNIGNDAATREPGVSADQYIHESLMDPNKFIAPNCPFGACVPGTMPQNVGQLMTPDEVELVVQFLLTRKGDS